MSFFEELKRRNVYRVGAAYGALAWAVIEITGTVAPALHLPEITLSLVTWIGIVGFPFALFFAWAFELTPEGLKRESEVDRSESIRAQTGRKLEYLIIALLTVALGFFVVDKFVLTPQRDAALLAAAKEVEQPKAAEQLAEEATAQAGKSDGRSIAVLPFVNMSSDPEQEYFSDGIAEELLNLLTRVRQLKVIARTSSFSYKGKDIPIEQIARELKVDHVLEGSVRKSAERVRITVQLIRASDSSHLWSETYDRNMEDIFAIQDEIAATVVDQLKLKLLGEVPTVRKTDPAAYALLLQGRQVGPQGTLDAFERAALLFEESVAIDPGFAEAWARLAQMRMLQARLGVSRAENDDATRQAATRALELNSDSAIAHAVLGQLALADLKLVLAAQQITRAVALEPGNPVVLEAPGVLALALGRPDDALAFFSRLIDRDPASAPGYQWLSRAYADRGQVDEALESMRTALKLSPRFITAQFVIGSLLSQRGELDAALDAVQAESHPGWRLVGLAAVHYARGEQAESDAALTEMINEYARQMPTAIAWALAVRNEKDRAFEWLEKAARYRDPPLARFVNSPVMRSTLRDDPRWLPFLESIGMSPAQLAAIEFEIELPE